jgi:hypothetical protein
MAVVVKYLKDYPKEWNKGGPILVVRPSRPSFGCEKK